MKVKHSEYVTVGYATYISTWIALIILSVVTITVTRTQTGAFGILIALIIATVQAGLILLIFMHLRYERWFFKLALLLPLIVFAFIIGFTFLDVMFR